MEMHLPERALTRTVHLQVTEVNCSLRLRELFPRLKSKV